MQYKSDEKYIKDTITEAMKHLAKKPARQGSNQSLENVVKPEQKKNLKS